MRTSLERAARHVHYVCRRRGSVCPQIIDWVNFIRPFDSSFERCAKDDALVFDAWRSVQQDSQARDPECWAIGLVKPDGHTVSVSGVRAAVQKSGMCDGILSRGVMLLDSVGQLANLWTSAGSHCIPCCLRVCWEELRRGGVQMVPSSSLFKWYRSS